MALSRKKKIIILVAGAVVLALIRPMVALPLLLFAVPFGGLTRGSSGDTGSIGCSFAHMASYW